MKTIQDASEVQAQKQALDKAKICLMQKDDSAFFTTLCFSLKQRFDDGHPTAYTDGRTITWNPKFFMKDLVDIEERVFLMLHETLHCAYLHTVRVQPGMCRDRANIAMDHVINLQLVERGFKMPTKVPGHADPQFKGMCWEEVYKLLPDNPGKPQMQDLGDPAEGLSGDEKNAAATLLEEEMQEILVRAAVQSKLSNDKPGTIPQDIQIFLNGLLNPQLPWNRILQKYLHSYAKNDYSFRKPNRRFFPKYHLPSMFSESLMDLSIAVDISGSVSTKDFHVFVSEVASILRMMKPKKITLIQFDTELKSVDTVGTIKDLMAIKFKGRGGTDITPVLEWANVNKPQLLMVFTDGHFKFPTLDTKRNTLWLIHNNQKFVPPFGKAIHYKI
jgi:predicted metal-dependent peptidase